MKEKSLGNKGTLKLHTKMKPAEQLRIRRNTLLLPAHITEKQQTSLLNVFTVLLTFPFLLLLV